MLKVNTIEVKFVDIELRRLDFEKSKKYFLKDYLVYAPYDCHTNAFVRFYDKNYKIVDENKSDYKFVIGLSVCFSKDGNYCCTHSWVMEKNKIVDVTLFANAFHSQNIKIYSIDKINWDEEPSKNLGYISYRIFTNREFDKICKTKCMGITDKNKVNKIMQDFLMAEIEKLENDKEFISEIEKKYNCKYVSDVFDKVIE